MPEKEYKNFSLKFILAAFKASSENKGVQIRIKNEDTEEWLIELQIDIHSNGPLKSEMMKNKYSDLNHWIY